jgi:PIN domain nuclease of toxin-antitoxin system
VLDASALLCFVFDEPGAENVEAAFADRAVIGAVNWAEVLSKVADVGGDPGEMTARLEGHGVLDDALRVVELTAADGLAIARLRPRTRDLGLSLGDRACLALAQRLGLPVLTCDRAWAHVMDAGVAVELVR